MYGQELAAEIGKRRGGNKPNPRTSYPVLKDLASRAMIKAHSEGHHNVYELTPRGQVGLSKSLEYFKMAFGEIVDSTIATSEPRKKSQKQS